MRVAGVVLAAGFSRRLGRPKQEVVLSGESLLERAVRVALEAGCAPVVAVVREQRWAGILEPLGVTVVLNGQAEEGMASSVRAGVAALEVKEVRGAVLMTCDQPGVTAAHLQALSAEGSRVTGSGYSGRVGVPAYFPESAFPALLQLEGDAGARGLLREAAVVVDEELALDVDTAADVARACARFDGPGTPVGDPR